MQKYNWADSQFKIRFQIDFEKDKNMLVSWADSNSDNFQPVISIPGILSFIDLRANFFSIQSYLGKKSTFLVDLKEFKLQEKARKLDVNENIQVSEHLTEEIFQKVNAFTTRISNDQIYMKKLAEGYASAQSKVNYFQALVVDLFRGTRKMEENVLESINRLSSLSPENIPKLARIKTYFETLRSKQKKLFDRFNGTADFGRMKKVMRKLRVNLRKIDRAIENITANIQSAEFDTTFGRISSVMDVLKGMSFKSDLEKVKQQVELIRERTKKGNSMGLIGLVGFGVIVFAGAYCMFKTIKRAEDV